MRFVQLGESLIIMKELTQSPATIAHHLNQNPSSGLLEAVPAFDQLALYFDPDLTTSTDLLAVVKSFASSSLPDSVPTKTGRAKTSLTSTPQNENPNPTNTHQASRGPSHHEIPALYSGPDFAEVAQSLTLTPNQLVELHSQATYTVEAIGFCPGFPYLSGLPAQLQNLPRRQTPRTKVEPGTIAITGDQCCIYPLERPGGWNLIAQTPFTLVDPESEYFPLQTGDTITFTPITKQQFDQMVSQQL